MLSKAVAPLLSPDTWVFFCAVAAFVFLGLERRRAAFLVLGTALALFALIAVIPVGYPILNALEQRYPPYPDVAQPAGIVVLGGGESGREHAATGQVVVTQAGDRLLASILLARTHPEAAVLFTGGIASLTPSGPSGADVAALVLARAGLGSDRLILEGRSRNTAENAALSLPLRTPGEGPWILVTSAFHMPRAVASFCAAGWTNLVPWPTDYRAGTVASGIGWDFSGHAQELELAVREIVGTLAYQVAGKAISPPPPGCVHGS